MDCGCGGWERLKWMMKPIIVLVNYCPFVINEGKREEH